MSILQCAGIRFGVSQKPYNFRATEGNAPASAAHRFLSEIGATADSVWFMDQTHSDHVRIVPTHHARPYYGEYIVADCDALITDKKHIALVSRVADCTPILLYDPVQQVQACIHSGWRPTLARIAKKAATALRNHYGTEPSDLYAFIGPTIGKDSFQVGNEVSALWRDAFDFAESVITYDDPEHDYIDIRETNRRILLEAGVLPARIAIDPADTMTDRRYHSYRNRTGDDYGTNALVSVLV